MSYKISTLFLIILVGIFTANTCYARKIKKNNSNKKAVLKYKKTKKFKMVDRPKLEPQERKTLLTTITEKKPDAPVKRLTRGEPAIYNHIKDWIGKDDDEDDDEDWNEEKKASKGTISNDLGEFSSGIKTAMKNHVFKIGDTPFSVQGLPILYPSSSTGLNIGARASLYDLTYEKPYSYNLMAQYWISDRGRRNHEAKFDIPHFFSKDWHLLLSYKYKVDIDKNFFGIGNDSEYDHSIVDQTGTNFISKSYYKYIFTHPNFVAQLQYRLPVERIIIFTGIGLEKNVITPIQYSTSSEQSYLLSSNPYGRREGKTNYINAGIMYDTRNYPFNPDSGTTLAFIHTRHTAFMKSNYIYESSNITYMRFNYFWQYFTLAHRAIFEGMKGDIPFYALGTFFSTEPMEGLGGGETLRGYPNFRFMDRIKFVNQLELRIRFYNGVVGGQKLRVDIVPYWDIGRVWSKLKLMQFCDFHNSFGSVIKLTWNKNFVVAITFGGSKDGINTGLSFGENFQ